MGVARRIIGFFNAVINLPLIPGRLVLIQRQDRIHVETTVLQEMTEGPSRGDRTTDPLAIGQMEAGRTVGENLGRFSGSSSVRNRSEFRNLRQTRQKTVLDLGKQTVQGAHVLIVRRVKRWASRFLKEKSYRSDIFSFIFWTTLMLIFVVWSFLFPLYVAPIFAERRLTVWLQTMPLLVLAGVLVFYFLAKKLTGDSRDVDRMVGQIQADLKKDLGIKGILPKDTFSNIVALLFVVVEWLQIIAFAFHSMIPWPTGGVLAYALNSLVLHFGFGWLIWAFLVAFLFALFWIIQLNVACRYEWRLGGATIIRLVSVAARGPMLLPVLHASLMAMNCRFDTPSQSYILADSGTAPAFCWTHPSLTGLMTMLGSAQINQPFVAVLSLLLGISIFFVSTLLLNLRREGPLALVPDQVVATCRETGDVPERVAVMYTWRKTYMMLEATLKFLLAYLAVLLRDEWNPRVAADSSKSLVGIDVTGRYMYLLACGLCVLGLFLLSLRFPPSKMRVVNVLRSGLMAGAVWCYACAAFAVNMSSKYSIFQLIGTPPYIARDNWWPLIFLVYGWLIMFGVEFSVIKRAIAKLYREAVGLAPS